MEITKFISIEKAERFEREMGQRLRQLRGDRSQEEVAKALGVRRETVKQWENAERHIKAVDLAMISAYYSVSADYLLGIDPRNSSEAVLRGVLAYHRRLKQTEKMNAGNEESVSDIFEEALIDAIEAIRERGGTEMSSEWFFRFCAFATVVNISCLAIALVRIVIQLAA